MCSLFSISHRKDTGLHLLKDEKSVSSLANLVGLYSASMTEEEAADFGFHCKVLPYVISKLPVLALDQQCKVIIYLERLLHFAKKTIEQLFKQAGIDVKDVVAAVIQAIHSCEKEHGMVPELLLHVCEAVFILSSECVQGINMENLTSRLIELAYLKCQEYKLRIESSPGMVR